MAKHFLKKIRAFRSLSAITLISLTILSFQNCAPQQNLCADNSSSCSTDQSSTATNSTSSGSTTGTTSVWTSRPSSGGGGVTLSGGTVSGGSTSTGSTSSSGGAVVVGGGDTSSGSTSSGSTSGSTTTTGGSLTITTQPLGVTVQEKAEFILSVTVSGGKSPYTYQWSKDNVAITTGMGNYYTYTDVASSFSKEGNYSVVVTDASGATVQSAMARVIIQEIAGSCDAASYFTFTNATYDTGYKYFTEYFDSSRGKFLLHKSYDTMGFLYSYRSYAGLYDYNVPTTLAYLGKTFMSCRTTIPRIHTPQQNPAYNSDWLSSQRYSDGGGYTYQGNVTFECHNKKMKFISDTCKWVYTAPATSTGKN